MNYSWSVVVVWSTLALCAAVTFIRQHYRLKRLEAQTAAQYRVIGRAYLQMLDDLDRVEELDTPLARAIAITDAQDRYLQTAQARHAS